jgi:hypothetical protein
MEEEQPRVRECIESAKRSGNNSVFWYGNLWPVTIEWLESEGHTVTPCDSKKYIIQW